MQEIGDAFPEYGDMIARVALVVKSALLREARIDRHYTGVASAILTFSLLFSSPAYAQTAKAVAAKAFPSLVLLVIQDRNGQPRSVQIYKRYLKALRSHVPG